MKNYEEIEIITIPPTTYDFSDEAMLGFYGDKEYYYLRGDVQSFKVGSLLLALTDIRFGLDHFVDDFHALNIMQIKSYSTSVAKRLFCDYASLFYSIYNYLSSLHPGLADYYFYHTFFNKLHDIFDPPSRQSAIYHYSPFGSYFRLPTHPYPYRIKYAFEELSKIESYDNYMELTKCQDDFKFLISAQIAFILSFRKISTALSFVLDNIIVRKDAKDTPLTRHIDYMDKASSLRMGNEGSLFSDVLQSFLANRSPALFEKTSTYPLFNYDEARIVKCFSYLCAKSEITSHVIGISDSDAGPYDLNFGKRLLNAYSFENILNVIFAEIHFMCMNNFELAICKNCGRFFHPLSTTSNFCDRPLSDGSLRTCKTMSSTWYSSKRRADDPVWDEYSKYRVRYASRTSKNKLTNPQERLTKWNESAKQLVRDYEAGEITQEQFSQWLKDTDKTMKPLDKM